jgi:hypothetical protein
MDAIIFLQRIMGEGRENIGRGNGFSKKEERPIQN